MCVCVCVCVCVSKCVCVCVHVSVCVSSTEANYEHMASPHVNNRTPSPLPQPPRWPLLPLLSWGKLPAQPHYLSPPGGPSSSSSPGGSSPPRPITSAPRVAPPPHPAPWVVPPSPPPPGEAPHPAPLPQLPGWPLLPLLSQGKLPAQPLSELLVLQLQSC